MPELPIFVEVEAPSSWGTIDFISDLHLWARGPRTFEAWSAYLHATPADAVFILGDLFEVWVGDDVRRQPFEAACFDVMKAAASSRYVAAMHGNRDFLLGAEALAEVGVTLLHDPTVLTAFGRRTLLTHGDELCLADVDYQRYRVTVRNPAFQAQFLARPLDERLAFVRKLRDDSDARKRAQPAVEDWVDLDLPSLLDWMTRASTPDVVHGHTHQPADETLAPGHIRRVLSDWDLDTAKIPRAEVLRLTAGGFERLSLLPHSTP
jgi:UDP-2,3-diacylglucosamine hydrolase